MEVREIKRADLERAFRAAKSNGERDKWAREICTYDARKGSPSARFMCRAKGWAY